MKVLVIGAGGFIGGAYAEHLYAAGIQVIAGIRQWSSAARIGRLPIDIVQIDIEEADSFESLPDDIDAVINCAVGSTEAATQGIDNLVSYCRSAGISKLVHLSTVDVYGTDHGKVTEELPRRRTGNAYGDMKIDSEERLEQLAGDLDIAILRPAIVYGPYSDLWTVRFAERMTGGSYAKFRSQGTGQCNLTYVYDLTGFTLHLLQSGWSGLTTYNVTSNDLLSWQAYWDRLAAALAVPEPAEAGDSSAGRLIVNLIRPVARLGLNLFPELIMKIYTSTPLTKALFRSVEQRLKSTPTNNELQLYQMNVRYDNTKMKEVGGYQPVTDVETGVAHSIAWLKMQGYPFFD